MFVCRIGSDAEAGVNEAVESKMIIKNTELQSFVQLKGSAVRPSLSGSQKPLLCSF